MDNEELLIKFQNFIKNQSIASVAVVDSNNSPWIFNIFYIIKEDLSLYFLSSKDSEHAKYIKKKSEVAVSIYSHESEHGSSKGLQAIGKVSEVTNPSDIKDIFDLYDVQFQNALPEETTYTDYATKSSNSRFYKIELSKVFYRDSENFEGKQEISLI